MQIQDLLIDPFQHWAPLQKRSGADVWQPLGFVDLDSCPHETRVDGLPPFPVIGMGDPTHPLASALDAVVEPPISADALLREIGRAPRAAAAMVQLLRSLEGLPCERALTLESICYGLLQGSEEYHAWLAARVPVAHPAPAGRINIERREAALHLVLDRPLARNAIDRVMRDQLFEAFTVAALDPELRSITLRATGGVFSMGGDLEEFGTTRDPATAHLIRSRSLPALALLPKAALLEVYVQGACVGAGLEIAAFAGKLTAASNAWFQLPELSMGLIPGAGGCVSVPRRIGRQRTTLMILSGRRINAATALRWGLIDAIEDLPTA